VVELFDETLGQGVFVVLLDFGAFEVPGDYRLRIGFDLAGELDLVVVDCVDLLADGCHYWRV